jgi:diadenosine tetraphosphate (Ap4A) HIT family hydrolase
MSEDPKEPVSNNDLASINDEEESDGDDLETYMKEIKILEKDFSDLEELEMEEILDMQEAISKVRESEESDMTATKVEEFVKTDNFDLSKEKSDYLSQRKAMTTDFSDLEEIDLDELKDMQEAINEVKQKIDIEQDANGTTKVVKNSISSELEERIRQELKERKEVEVKEIITPDKFLAYIKDRRDKIWYHSLHYILFNTEDHIASKELLYEMLKEVTSKSPIDPIPEHQFYFGLGYLLKLSLNDRKVIKYIKGGKFKVNTSIEVLREILREAGEPISTRPIIKEEEKKKMFKAFLDDDFQDI